MLDALDDTPPHAGPETDVRDAQARIAARPGQRLADAQTANLLRGTLRCPRDCNGDNGQGERAANDRAITATLPRPCQPRCAREAGSRATWHEPGEPWLPAPGDQVRQQSRPVVGGWACGMRAQRAARGTSFAAPDADVRLAGAAGARGRRQERGDLGPPACGRA